MLGTVTDGFEQQARETGRAATCPLRCRQARLYVRSCRVNLRMRSAAFGKRPRAQAPNLPNVAIRDSETGIAM